jgi:hypothetical protein
MKRKGKRELDSFMPTLSQLPAFQAPMSVQIEAKIHGGLEI